MPVEPPIEPASLDARLQRAARGGDARALAEGYGLAAQRAERAGRADEAGFFLTHAYVWALVAGDRSTARSLARALRLQGRLD